MSIIEKLKEKVETKKTGKESDELYNLMHDFESGHEEEILQKFSRSSENIQRAVVEKMVNFINNDEYSYFYNSIPIRKLLENIPSDELKIELMDKYNEVNSDIILSIKNIDKKLEVLEKYKDKLDARNIANIISSVPDVDGKVSLLEKYSDKLNETNIARIILSEPEADKKLELLEKCKDKLDGTDIVDIISNMTEVDKKVEVLEKYKDKLDGTDIANIILSESEVGKKVELLEKYKDKLDGTDITRIILSESEVDKKLELLEKCKDKLDGTDITRIILSEPEEDKKLELLEKCKYKLDGTDIANIILSESEVGKKVELLEKYNDKLDGKDITRIISDVPEVGKKVELLEKYKDKLDGTDITRIILDVSEVGKKVELLEEYKDKLDGKDITRIISDVPEVGKKVELLEKCKDKLDGTDIANIILDVPEVGKKVELLEKYNDKLDGIDITRIISDVPEVDKKVELLEKYKKKLDYEGILSVKSTMSTEYIKNNLSRFFKLENTEYNDLKKNTLLDMYTKNADVYIQIDFRILDKKYVDCLGEEKINLISCYPEIQSKVLNLSDKELNLFSKCIKSFADKSKSEEWTNIANNMLSNISSYNELLNNINININAVDIEKLTKIMQTSNIFNIKTEKDINNFEKIKVEKADEWIKSDNIEDRRLAVYEKAFGHDSMYADEIIKKYGEGVKELPDSSLKKYIQCLIALKHEKNSEKLSEIYSNCIETTFVDKEYVVRNLKTDFCKLYNEGLFDVKNGREVEKNIYEAGTDFKMIVTSVGAFARNNAENYKEDWNRPSLASQHFCASYIRNDMIGTAPIHNICYGFRNMKEDSLMLSGNRDMASSIKDFQSIARNTRAEVYLSPEKQINNTSKYNEMDFRRIQGNEKKQPDYLVVFRKDGRIDNMSKTLDAQKQWGDLPIVIVDKDKCLENEKQKVEKMLQEFQENPSEDLKKKITQKITNNRKTERNFCSNLDLERFELKSKDNSIYEKDKKELNIDDIKDAVKSLKTVEIGDIASETNEIIQGKLQEQEKSSIVNDEKSEKKNNKIGIEDIENFVEDNLRETDIKNISKETEKILEMERTQDKKYEEAQMK